MRYLNPESPRAAAPRCSVVPSPNHRERDSRPSYLSVSPSLLVVTVNRDARGVMYDATGALAIAATMSKPPKTSSAYRRPGLVREVRPDLRIEHQLEQF